MSDLVFSPAIEPMPAMDNVELGLVMAVDQDFIVASGADDLVVESSGISLTFSPLPASVTFTSFAGLGDEYVWYCPTLDPITPWDCITTGIDLNLTPQNASITSDPDGEAYTFSGSSASYATNFAKVTNRSEFSYSFWVKGSASTSEVVGVVGQSNINNARGSIVGSYQNSSQGGNGSKVHFFYQSNPSSYNSDQRLQSVATVFDSTWHHVAVTFQGGSRVNIYVDGVLDNTTSSSVPSQISDVWQFELGRYAGSNGFSGSLDDVRVFTRVITAGEVSWLATARGVQGPPPPPPVGLGDEKIWLCPSLDDSANDISGNNNDGTYQGGMGTVADTGEGGTLAYSFDGSNDYINTTGFNISQTAYSVSLWMNLSGPSNQTQVTFNTSNGSANRRSCNIGIGSTGVAIGGHQTTSGNYFVFATTVVNNAGWKHVLYTYNGSNLEIFVDGISEGTASAVDADVPQTVGYIGRIGGSSPSWLYGKLDDIRAYDRAVTQEEITHLASQRGILGPPVSGFLNPFTNPVFQNQFFSSKVIR